MFTRKNNEHYVQLLTISEVKDEAGEISHYIGTFNGITNSK